MDKMTDEEIKECALEIIQMAYQTADLPSSVSIVESEEGIIGFKFDISSDFVSGYTVYSPQPFLEKLIKSLNTQENDSEDNLVNNVLQKMRPQYTFSFAQDMAEIITKMMVREFTGVAHFLLYLAQDVFNIAYLDQKISLKTKRQQIGQFQEIIQKRNAPRNERILSLLREYTLEKPAPQYIFCDVYKLQLKHWQGAKKCYTENKKYQNPLEMVKSAFNYLPEDLINLLEDMNEDTAQPSSIALEHTAQMFHLPAMAKRTLERYLTDSKTQREKISDEEAERALNEFIDFAKSVEMSAKMFQEAIADSLTDQEFSE